MFEIVSENMTPPHASSVSGGVEVCFFPLMASILLLVYCCFCDRSFSFLNLKWQQSLIETVEALTVVASQYLHFSYVLSTHTNEDRNLCLLLIIPLSIWSTMKALIKFKSYSKLYNATLQYHVQ